MTDTEGTRRGVSIEDPRFVARQYENTANLDARISLHRRFSANPLAWHRWVFDRFDLSTEAKILEVGCGPGNLWAENADRLPTGWTVTLTDASEGMLREAESRLGGDERFAFRVADARELPFDGGTFDAVVANHVLYHLPDRDPALAGISRILKPDGTLYAATNGSHAHKEMGWMQRVLDPSRPDDRYFQTNLSFSLENGEEQLSRWFGEVSLLRREDALVVTEVEPLMEYLLSGSAADAAREREGHGALGRRAAVLRERLDEQLATEGGIRITKDSGLFVARGPR